MLAVLDKLMDDYNARHGTVFRHSDFVVRQAWQRDPNRQQGW